jgi:hypothetical protein
MIEVEGITATPDQTFFVVIPEGSIDIRLMFKPAISMWYMNISFKTFSFNGIKLVDCQNLLSQYENIIPFGIHIVSGGVDPFLINDFSSGRAVFNVIDQSEIAEINQAYREIKDEIFA